MKGDRMDLFEDITSHVGFSFDSEENSKVTMRKSQPPGTLRAEVPNGHGIEHLKAWAGGKTP